MFGKASTNSFYLYIREGKKKSVSKCKLEDEYEKKLGSHHGRRILNIGIA